MIEYFKRVSTDRKIKKVQSYCNNCWVNLLNPSEDEIDFAVKEFKLEKDNVLDGLDVFEVPRTEEENKKAYIFLRVPFNKERQHTVSFLIILDNHKIITISKEPVNVLNKIKENKIKVFTDKKINFLVKILSYISKEYNASVRKIIKEVKSDQRNLIKLKEKDISDLILREDALNDYLYSFIPLINLHKRIVKLKAIKFNEEEKEFVEDLIIDLDQTFLNCRTTLKTLSSMRDYYSASLSNKINRTITVLTIFTVFLTIPTVLSSIYGMNVPLPFQDQQNFILFFLIITIVLWIIAFISFKKIEVF